MFDFFKFSFHVISEDILRAALVLNGNFWSHWSIGPYAVDGHHHRLDRMTDGVLNGRSLEAGVNHAIRALLIVPDPI